jgi:hypothetical protein
MTDPYQHYPQTPQPYGQPYSLAPREHPQGNAVLILGIVGLFVTICAPFAWYLGSKALKEIRASGVTYANEQSIVIGRILGMIVTILGIIGIVFFVIFGIIIAITASVGSN